MEQDKGIHPRDETLDLREVKKDKLEGVFEVNVNGTVNNSKLIHEFIINICENSSEEKGIALSPEYFDKMRRVKDFNCKEISFSERKAVYKEYIELVIRTIYEYLSDRSHLKDDNDRYTEFFINWLKKYSDGYERAGKYENRVIYRIEDEGDYKGAVIDFISGMTDKIAMDYYNQLIRF